MYFTILWSKEKEDDCYLQLEKVVHSYLEHENKDPSYLEVVKTGSQLFRARKTLWQLLGI